MKNLCFQASGTLIMVPAGMPKAYYHHIISLNLSIGNLCGCRTIPQSPRYNNKSNYHLDFQPGDYLVIFAQSTLIPDNPLRSLTATMWSTHVRRVFTEESDSSESRIKKGDKRRLADDGSPIKNPSNDINMNQTVPEEPLAFFKFR